MCHHRLTVPLILLVLIGCHAISEGAAIVPVSKVTRLAYQRVAKQLATRMARKGLRLGAPIFIRIFKKSGELEVWVEKKKQFTLFKTYTICHLSGELGPKQQQGDKQSPEGFYTVSAHQMNPWSNFHLSFDLGYPNDYDLAHHRTGNSIMVHGQCVSAGCFAMTDYWMDEIYTLADAALASGQGAFSVHVFPFRMTDENMHRHQRHRWYSFWQNLKEGYDLFQHSRIPPEVFIVNDSYSFSQGGKNLFLLSQETPHGNT